MRNMFIEDELVKGFLCPNTIVDIIKDTRDKPWSRSKAMLYSFARLALIKFTVS